MKAWNSMEVYRSWQLQISVVVASELLWMSLRLWVRSLWVNPAIAVYWQLPFRPYGNTKCGWPGDSSVHILFSCSRMLIYCLLFFYHQLVKKKNRRDVVGRQVEKFTPHLLCSGHWSIPENANKGFEATVRCVSTFSSTAQLTGDFWGVKREFAYVWVNSTRTSGNCPQTSHIRSDRGVLHEGSY